MHWLAVLSGLVAMSLYGCSVDAQHATETGQEEASVRHKKRGNSTALPTTLMTAQEEAEYEQLLATQPSSKVGARMLYESERELTSDERDREDSYSALISQFGSENELGSFVRSQNDAVIIDTFIGVGLKELVNSDEKIALLRESFAPMTLLEATTRELIESAGGIESYIALLENGETDRLNELLDQLGPLARDLPQFGDDEQRRAASDGQLPRSDTD